MAIYNGTQKIDVSGVDKVYVGTQLVYQKVTKQIQSIDITSWPTTSEDINCWDQVGSGTSKLCVYWLYKNEPFSFPGTITATYDDGTTEDVTNQCVYTGYDMTTANNNTAGYGLTISYTYNGTTVTVPQSTLYSLLTTPACHLIVVKELDYITISGYNTTLYKNDAFAFGGTVTATYVDGSTADVTSENATTYSGYNMSIADTYTVTVTYTNRASYSILAIGQWKAIGSDSATYQLTVSEYKTLWEGSVTRTRNATGSAVTTDIVDLSSQGYSGNKTFRITCSATSTGSYTYYSQNNSQVSSWTSPFTTTINTSNPDSLTTTAFGVVRGGTSATAYWYVQLQWRYADFKFQLYDAKSIFGTPTDASASMTITKIEEYIP